MLSFYIVFNEKQSKNAKNGLLQNSPFPHKNQKEKAGPQAALCKRRIDAKYSNILQIYVIPRLCFRLIVRDCSLVFRYRYFAAWRRQGAKTSPQFSSFRLFVPDRPNASFKRMAFPEKCRFKPARRPVCRQTKTVRALRKSSYQPCKKVAHYSMCKIGEKRIMFHETFVDLPRLSTKLSTKGEVIHNRMWVSRFQ